MTTTRIRFSSRPAFAWAVMTIAFLAVFGAIGLGRFGYSAILPVMQAQLGLTSQQAGALASWNLGGYVVFAVLGGALSSRFGVRAIASIGLLVAALGMALTGLADGLVSVGARLISGFGGGLVLVPCTALMSAWFPASRRGLASGIVSSGMALGLIVSGPLVPRVMTAGGESGWRYAWFLLAGVVFVLSLANPLVMRNRPVKIVRHEAIEPGHLEWCRVIKSPYSWHLGLIYMFWGYAYMTYFVFLQKRLIGDLGFSPSAAGNVFMILGIASLACGLLWGSVSDRIGRKYVMTIMLAAEGAASALFAFASQTPYVVLSAVVFGLTAVGFVGIMGAACGDRFGADLAPTALGFVTLFVGVGQAAGPIVAGMLQDIYGSLTPALIVSSAVFVVGTASALLLKTGTGSSQRKRTPATVSSPDDGGIVPGESGVAGRAGEVTHA